MATLILDGAMWVKLDSDGRIEGVGWRPDSPGYTEVAELPLATRRELAQRVRIRRHNVILPDGRPHTYLRGCIDGHDCTGHTIEGLLVAHGEKAECIDYVDDPNDAARRASIILAGDYGIRNEIQRNDYNGYDVVTDENKRFQFRRK